MKNKIKIIILTIVIVLPSILKADTTHYKNILVGDRAANMAGAFIALSDDSSGCYYNPAGISYTVGTNLSGSVNAYHIQHSKYDDAIRGYDWKRNSAELLPNFFGVIKNHGKHSFGLSVVVPDSFVQHQDQEIDDLPASGGMEAIKRYTLNRHEEDSTTISGITYAYEFNPSLAVGATLNYFHRKYRMGNNQTLMYEDNTFVGSFYNSSWGEKGIYPKIGVRWAPHEKVNFGLTISKIFIIESRWDSMSQIKERNSSDLVYSKNDSKVQRSTPFELGIGMALLPFSDTIFTFDVNLYTDPGINEFAPYGYDSVLNFSFAVEYAINKKNVVRLGYFTNNTAAPMPNDNTKGLEHIDMWGISTGYSIHNESTSFTVGMVYSKGAGTAQIYDNSSRIVNLNRYSLTGLLSTNYKL
jgi:long-subunit fatty acid transport protein